MKMRLGAQISPERFTWPEYLQAFQTADEAGLDTAWVPDHFLPTLSADKTGPHPDCWTLLAALAMKTHRIRIGSLVTCVGFRHPSVVARIAAGVDIVSGGRLEFGIGAGWMAEEHTFFGMPFPPAAERVKRLDEAVQICRLLWTQTTSDFQGQYYQLKGAPLAPKPVQKPHPPIVIGGSGEKLTLRVVAKFADEWNVVGSPSMYAKKARVLEEHCRAIGRDPKSIRRSAAMPLVMADDPAVGEKVVQTMAERRRISPDEARGMMLVGTPQEVAKQVQAWLDLGVSHLIIQVTQPQLMASVVRLAKEVLPKVG